MERLPLQERHLCFLCLRWFNPYKARLCRKCYWLTCPSCGLCVCNLGEEGRRVLKAFALTFCEGCCYGQFPRKKRAKRPWYFTESKFIAYAERAFPAEYARYRRGEIPLTELVAEVSARLGRTIIITEREPPTIWG